MFRKPKRGANKASLRSARKADDDDEDDHGCDEDQNDDDEQDVTPTSTLFQGGRNKSNKKLKMDSSAAKLDGSTSNSTKQDVLHHFDASASSSAAKTEDLATRTAQHHPEKSTTVPTTDGRGTDGIYREKTRNPFLAGPIKASTNVRMTSRFDYQPDICKDYKDTGFCGYGDTCIYLHDRGDTLTGWQLEEQWQEQQKLKQQHQQADMEAFADGTFQTTESGKKANVNNAELTFTDDGLPFACHICRQPFTDPIVTSCGHYFCEKCIVEQVRSSSDSNCPICRKDTHGVFNQPTKLLAKKRRLVGAQATWNEFAEACTSAKATS